MLLTHLNQNVDTMKPVLRSFSLHPERSFLVRKDIGAPVYSMWHQHAEIELFFIRGGQGGMMIGDKEIPIDGSSQMIVLGSNLPHTMSYGNQANGHVVEAVVVHINPAVWGAFYELPEMTPIRNLFKNTERGIYIKDDLLQQMETEMFALVDDDPPQSMIRLMQLLLTIATSQKYDYVASQGYASTHSRETDNSRMSKIYNYVLCCKYFFKMNGLHFSSPSFIQISSFDYFDSFLLSNQILLKVLLLNFQCLLLFLNHQ